MTFVKEDIKYKGWFKDGLVFIMRYLDENGVEREKEYSDMKKLQRDAKRGYLEWEF